MCSSDLSYLMGVGSGIIALLFATNSFVTGIVFWVGLRLLQHYQCMVAEFSHHLRCQKHCDLRGWIQAVSKNNPREESRQRAIKFFQRFQQLQTCFRLYNEAIGFPIILIVASNMTLAPEVAGISMLVASEEATSVGLIVRLVASALTRLLVLYLISHTDRKSVV